MQIKPITGTIAPAIDETRDEERRKKKEDRQKNDKNAAGVAPEALAECAETPSAGTSPATPVRPPEVPSQIVDSESLVKLLEHSPAGARQNGNPFLNGRKSPEKKDAPPNTDGKKLNKAL